MESGIYRIRNLKNDKSYVGRAVDLERRKAQHLESLRAGTSHNPHLQNSWNKWGEENFLWEVLEACDGDSLMMREAHWINELDACNPSHGFNMRSENGDGTWRLSDETRAEWSKNKKALWADGKMKNHPWTNTKGENNPRWGVVMDDDLKERIRQSVRETVAREPERFAKSDETRLRMKEAAKKRWANKTPEEKSAIASKRGAGRKDRSQSEETKRKKSESMKRTLAAKKLQKDAQECVLVDGSELKDPCKEETNGGSRNLGNLQVEEG